MKYVYLMINAESLKVSRIVYPDKLEKRLGGSFERMTEQNEILLPIPLPVFHEQQSPIGGINPLPAAWADPREALQRLEALEAQAAELEKVRDWANRAARLLQGIIDDNRLINPCNLVTARGALLAFNKLREESTIATIEAEQ